MIICTSRKFIFVHNPKAAGTSIQHALKSWDDGRQLKARTKHETITKFQRRTKMKLDGYFIFGFVRNPWDRFSSFFHFLKKQPEKFPQIRKVRDVNDLALRIDERWLKDRYSVQPQHSYFNKNTFIGRFEHLERDLQIISVKIGIEINKKHKNRSADHDYTKLFNDEGREIITERYSRDIYLYDYKFGDGK